MRMPRFLLTLTVLLLVFAPQVDAEDLPAALERAGPNRAQLVRALAEVPGDQRTGLAWLITRMPDADLQALDAEFLLEHTRHAYEAWRSAPWHEDISEEIFLDAILPYASINERRDRWRADFRERFGPLVADAKSPGEAAAILNQKIFPLVGVKYSTKRPKADQSPYESIDAGMASCTGLTVLLVDACRAVGVPARFVGTPLWSDGSGNHSWAEVWDDGWRFTGAAEPTGMELDRGWFTGRASGAKRDVPRNAIYATTWRRTPIAFPMVWRPGDTSVNAVNVTDRYTKKAVEVPEGRARVRLRVMGTDDERRAVPVKILRDGEEVFSATTKDERFDANDHVEAVLVVGEEYEVQVGGVRRSLEVTGDEQLFTIVVEGDEQSSAAPVDALKRWLADGGSGTLADQPFAGKALSSEEVEVAQQLLWSAHRDRIRAERTGEMEELVLEVDGVKMPFWHTTYGEKPEGGRSLWISMHGGGGAPARVNTRQWENQKRLYKPAEGVYVAPRAPTDTWNLWHQGHIDGLFDRLIENMIVFEDVNPEKVYVMGYSAGGDGVYHLAARMADRWAGAAMMAGHPNNAQPDSLRNTAFTLHMGGEDGAYQRNEVARSWKRRLAELQDADPGGYDHWVEIHEGKGHWMDLEDAAAVPWMAKRTRNSRPERIVWLQGNQPHPRFYWLATDEPTRGARLVAEREGQVVRIEGDGSVRIRLDDEMLDLEQPVIVLRNGEEVFRGVVPRTIGTIARTLAERGDSRGVYSAEIVLE
ncbi:MAG: hypothetical protein MK085_04285 [Phycisphaerales bacterium]|nr:hypothetical protein [Phycisphaerales bacterium]